jgi:GNAT superfamily N-acetyltransferase
VTGDAIVTLSSDRDPRAEAVISEGLAAFNGQHFRPSDRETLDVLVRDEGTGAVTGGIVGHTSYGLFFLDLFYLPEERRGTGLGSRLVSLAEEEARRRGCSAAFVYTVTFQAPGFYERLGYSRFGEVAAPPDGATRIFLSKRLD